MVARTGNKDRRERQKIPRLSKPTFTFRVSSTSLSRHTLAQSHAKWATTKRIRRFLTFRLAACLALFGAAALLCPVTDVAPDTCEPFPPVSRIGNSMLIRQG
jgi:hypothetical protein